MPTAITKSSGLCAKKHWKKWATFLGIYLMNFWMQVGWIWGNLSVYTFSYYLYTDPDSDDVEAPWMTGAYYICWSIGFILSNKLLSKMSKKRLVLLVGLTCTNGGMLLSYLAVQVSPMLLNITLGALTGFGSGIVDAIGYMFILEWTDTYMGLATASLQAVQTLCAVFGNIMVTYYINPDNLEPDKYTGKVKYFTQEEIVSRVPLFFLLLGCTSVLFNFIGFVLIQDKSTKDEYSSIKPIVANSDCKECKTDYTSEKQCTCKMNRSMSGEEEAEDRSASGQEMTKGEQLSTYQMCSYESFPDDQDKKSHEEFESFSPLQVLKSRSFYALTLTSMSTNVSFINVSTYFKAYGSLYIADDHYLTSIATVTSLVVCLSVAGFGAMSDIVGVKTMAISACSSMTILSAFYYLTPRINKWLYMFFSTAYSGLAFGLFNMVLVGTLRIFGQRHFTSNYGMVSMSSVLINIFAPPVTEIAIVQYGWTFMYLAISGINFGTLLLFIFGIPQI